MQRACILPHRQVRRLLEHLDECSATFKSLSGNYPSGSAMNLRCLDLARISNDLAAYLAAEPGKD